MNTEQVQNRYWLTDSKRGYKMNFGLHDCQSWTYIERERQTGLDSKFSYYFAATWIYYQIFESYCYKCC